MTKFNFEKNLNHQTQAVNSIVNVFNDFEIKTNNIITNNYTNPEFIENEWLFLKTIKKIQADNEIDGQCKKDSNIIDIMMETGTGKTYTYTKTIFELNKNYGIFKFIIVVPTLSIKAGTISFLKSDSAREHFKEQYNKSINLHIIESKKGSKNKKQYMPSAVNDFVKAGVYEKDKIQVLIINQGMINSDTMTKKFDTNMFDKYFIPFDAISATKAFMIIDEPHKFKKDNKTWNNLEKMNPQFIIRYGATFPQKETTKKDIFGQKIIVKQIDYHNLIYTLSSADSFNRNLVKGVIGHISEFKDGENLLLKFTNSDGNEASFELSENYKKDDEQNTINTKKTFKLSVKESLEKIHPAMENLIIEQLNKNEVVLSNGLSMKKSDKINPYSYNSTLQEQMIKGAIKNHFKLEKEFLTRDVKIKPLSLFFIDNIDEYRNEKGSIKQIVNECIKAEATHLLETEQNEFYKKYLEQTLKDIPSTHGGYFSKDNTDKDDVIQKEINEILHDKASLLDLKNTRRFIFSKWTLREGWDNPNVFGICKIRSSGSDISKLQEVGRGLRLPVNEYGNRVKDKQFYLNYFVDFSESDFVDKLINEINEKSGTFSREDNPDKLNEKMIKKICEIYGLNEDSLLVFLDENNVIDRANNFKKNGFDFIKTNYPKFFDGVDSNKIRKSTDQKQKISIRYEKYIELKKLWEKLNEKVILEYKIQNEEEFKNILVSFLNQEKDNFNKSKLQSRKIKIEFDNKKATPKELSSIEDSSMKISTMKYSDFLKQLSKELNMNLKTIHNSFVESQFEINNFLNNSSIRAFKHKFNDFLMLNAMTKFEISYKKVSNEIHPTKFTDKNGEALKDINVSDIGVNFYDGRISDDYLLTELFADSELEKDNIISNIDEVVVFSKIPKNSIKIPVAGGKSYSPDFAYVLKKGNKAKKIYFVIETKNTDETSLRDEENQKIKHAEKFFGKDIKITFKTQFSNKKITQLIQETI